MKALIAFLATLFVAGSTLAAEPQRIVSIGGAITEIVYALGAGEQVVGSDTTSYFPPQAANTPKVGYQRALSAEGIISLSPDLVLLSPESGPPPVLAQLESVGLKLVRLKAGRNLNDVRTNMRTIGDALGQSEKATALIKDFMQDETKLHAVISDAGQRKRVLFILQPGGGPPMVSGAHTAADSIIALAGGENAVVDYNGYKLLTPESAIAAEPDVILLTSQGLEAFGGIDGLRRLPGLALTPAIKNNDVIAMDALLLLGFGPRTVEAAMTLNRKLSIP